MKLTAANTGIVLDSTADFPDAQGRFPNWRVVPLYVRFGADSYRDYVDMGPAEFYERLRTAEELPTTSQPTPQDFAAAYEELAGLERVLVLTVSAKLSGTYASAQQAADETGGRVRVIDTATASAAISMSRVILGGVWGTWAGVDSSTGAARVHRAEGRPPPPSPTAEQSPMKVRRSIPAGASGVGICVLR